jgi:hypothetical protein
MGDEPVATRDSAGRLAERVRRMSDRDERVPATDAA